MTLYINNIKRHIGLYILGAGVIGLSIYIIYTYNIVEDKSHAILKVLKSNCKCDQVNQFLYVKGLQISEKGISTETAEYKLKNCKYTNLKKEANRINELLIHKVDGYKDIDRFTMEFVNRNSTKLITINNGIINN